jgi:uncharacterized protein (TIGR00251 family)
MKIRVRVSPKSVTDEIVGEGDTLVARVKEPPQEGRANQAVMKLLARHFHVPVSQVRIRSGVKSRNKVFEILT